MSNHQRKRDNDRGQAMVEFAFVLPILVVLVLGIVQFGIVFHDYMTLTDAVRSGARQAAVSRVVPNPTTVAVNRVRSAAKDLKDYDDDSVLTVTVTPRDPVSGSATFVQGGDVTVKASYPYSIKLLGFVVKDGRLTSETTERVE